MSSLWVNNVEKKVLKPSPCRGKTVRLVEHLCETLRWASQKCDAERMKAMAALEASNPRWTCCFLVFDHKQMALAQSWNAVCSLCVWVLTSPRCPWPCAQTRWMSRPSLAVVWSVGTKLAGPTGFLLRWRGVSNRGVSPLFTFSSYFLIACRVYPACLRGGNIFACSATVTRTNTRLWRNIVALSGATIAFLWVFHTHCSR